MLTGSRVVEEGLETVDHIQGSHNHLHELRARWEVRQDSTYAFALVLIRSLSCVALPLTASKSLIHHVFLFRTASGQA